MSWIPRVLIGGTAGFVLTGAAFWVIRRTFVPRVDLTDRLEGHVAPDADEVWHELVRRAQ